MTDRIAGLDRRRILETVGPTLAVGTAGCLTSDGTEAQSASRIPDEPPDEEVTIEFAVGSNTKKNEDDLVDALERAGLADTVTLDFVVSSQVTNKRQVRYRNWLISGNQQPTLFQTDSGWTIPFMVDNLLQNLSQSLPPEMVERVQNNYFQASLDTASMGGDLFAIPLYVDFPAMLYRKDLVMEAGYDPSDWATEPMSWKRFSEVTRDVQTQTDTTYGFTFQAQNYEGLACCTFNEFMTSMGGAYFGDHENLFGPVGDRPITVDDESVLKAIKLVRTFIANDSDDNTLDGYASGITPGDVLTWAEIPSFEPFANGNAVMHRNWPFVIPKAAKPESEGGFGTDVGMMPMPYGVTESAAAFEGAGGSASALGGWHVAMNPNSTPTQKQAAVQVLKAMLTEQFQLEAFTIAGWSPPNSKRFNSEKARDVPIVGRYLDTLLVAGEHAVPRPVTKVWSKESDQIASRVHAALSGKASPEEAMARLKSSLKQIENGQ